MLYLCSVVDGHWLPCSFGVFACELSLFRHLPAAVNTKCSQQTSSATRLSPASPRVLDGDEHLVLPLPRLLELVELPLKLLDDPLLDHPLVDALVSLCVLELLC